MEGRPRRSLPFYFIFLRGRDQSVVLCHPRDRVFGDKARGRPMLEMRLANRSDGSGSLGGCLPKRWPVQKRSRPFLPLSPPTTTSGLRPNTSPSSFTTLSDATMLTIANRTATTRRSVQRVAAGMATAARIGDTKVPMSLLEPGWYINYQRIEDNLAVVRDRCVSATALFLYFCSHPSYNTKG